MIVLYFTCKPRVFGAERRTFSAIYQRPASDLPMICLRSAYKLPCDLPFADRKPCRSCMLACQEAFFLPPLGRFLPIFRPLCGTRPRKTVGLALNPGAFRTPFLPRLTAKMIVLYYRFEHKNQITIGFSIVFITHPSRSAESSDCAWSFGKRICSGRL